MTIHPRREFLLRVLAACGTPWAAAVVEGQAGPKTTAGGTDARAAVRYFGAGADATRVIGEAYLRQSGVEPTRASILAHSGDALEILEKVRGEKAVLSALVDAVRRDFREGRVVEVEGWVLSRTEVQLCALTLLPPVK